MIIPWLCPVTSHAPGLLQNSDVYLQNSFTGLYRDSPLTRSSTISHLTVPANPDICAKQKTFLFHKKVSKSSIQHFSFLSHLFSDLLTSCFSCFSSIVIFTFQLFSWSILFLLIRFSPSVTNADVSLNSILFLYLIDGIISWYLFHW